MRNKFGYVNIAPTYSFRVCYLPLELIVVDATQNIKWITSFSHFKSKNLLYFNVLLQLCCFAVAR